jgi:tetratricopeptide (TPR) repeat protein
MIFRAFFPCFMLLILCSVTYGHVLTHHFMMDDFSFLDPKNIPAFYPHFTDFFTKSSDQHYDPLYNLINVSLFRYFPWPFPLYFINLGLFYSNCVLLFFLVFQISKNFFVAILTSTFFCIHPMSGEIIQHITLNNILLSTSLMLAGLLFFYKYLTQKNNINFYIVSIFILFLALLCHEICMLFVLYAAFMAFILKKFSLRETIKICVPFFLVEVLFFILWLVLAAPKAFLSRNIQEFHLSFWDLSANYFHLIIWYISNLFFPRDIVFMHNAPPLKDFIWLWNLFFWGFLSGFLALLFYFRRSLDSFALVLFFSGFFIAVPAFAARPDMGFVFEPYWLYFSSVGFYLFIILIFFKIKDNINRSLWVIFLPIIFMYFFIQTQQLNLTASTQRSYCENWLRQSPGNTIPAGILAQEYILNNIDIPLEFFPPMLSMADVYLKNGHWETAFKLISKLSSLDLSFDQRQGLLFRTAVAYYKSGHPDKGQNIFGKVLHSSFDYIQLSYIFYQAGEDDIALDILKGCRSVYPRYKEAYLLEGTILANQKHYVESIHLWEQGSKIDPTDERFRTNIENAMKFIR